MILPMGEWIEVPPQYGGGRHKITDRKSAPCPSCGGPGSLHVILGDIGVGAAECIRERKVIWYRLGDTP